MSKVITTHYDEQGKELVKETETPQPIEPTYECKKIYENGRREHIYEIVKCL